MRTLFCIVGRTASGKDTLTNIIAKENNMKVLLSYTTRPKRSENEDTHVFVTDAEYNADRDNNSIVAFTEINNYKYWSTIQQVLESDLYIIDPRGLKELKSKNLDLKIVSIYIDVDEYSRRQRFLMRQPDATQLFYDRNTSETLQFIEFEAQQLYDYKIENYRFEDALKELTEIINKEK